jgi:ion channel-forming bestrophin family protein
MIIKYKFKIEKEFDSSKENVIYSLMVVFIAVVLKVTNFYHDWDIPVSITAILGTALSILLGFSNSQAYDRWWEARKVWGGIVNDSRSFAKQVLTFIQAEDKSENTEIVKKEIIYRHFAFTNALRLQLRELSKPEIWLKEVKPFLSETEYTSITKSTNSATQLIKMQSVAIRKLYDDELITEFMFLEMDACLTRFYTYQGQAERIKKTSFLPTYHFFARIFLYFFITFLPFSLLSSVDLATTTWMLVPITVAIGWVFHMIYRNGHVYAYPFSNNVYDTPMSSICNTIEIDLKEMMGDDSIPEKVVAIDGVLM